MTENTAPGYLADIFAQDSVDIHNLEVQIRELLKSMEVVESIVNVPTITLPEIQPDIHMKDFRTETRMEWHRSDDSKKLKTGKMKSDNVPVTSFNSSVEKGDLGRMSNMDLLVNCVNENTSKYIPVPDSTFFVPVLDNCVFGMSLLNSGATKLKKPNITISLLQPTDIQGTKKSLCRCFLYDVQINLKESNVQITKQSKTEEGLPCQNAVSFEVDPEFEVMPGCELMVTATFVCPMQLLTSNADLRLLVSAYLDNKELWAREIPITHNCFSATYIDNMFKSHHSSIVTALGVQRESFKVERLLSQDKMSPHGSLKRFLVPLGFEKIQTSRTGIDTVIEVYTTQQPSTLWGTCIKIEKCNRKPSCVRCLVTSRTSEQMLLIFTQLKLWLKNEKVTEQKHGLTGISISSITKKNNFSICNQLLAEIDLILKFQQVKSILKRDKESGQMSKRSRRNNDLGSIDSCWIYEYCKSVEKTDMIFIFKTVM